MKITKDEFKEFINIYQTTWNNYDKYADIFDSDFLSELMFPLFDWMEEKLGTADKSYGNILLGYVSEEGKAWDDLDTIYNELIKGD